MKIASRNTITAYASLDTEATGQMACWLVEVIASKWKTAADLKDQFPLATVYKKRLVHFALGKKHSVVARVNFSAEILLILHAGPHQEFDNTQLEVWL